MEELISKSAARIAVLKACPTAAYCINNIQPVDAVVVQHAKWIPASDKPGVSVGMKCSLCKARISYSEFYGGNHRYCHKCGAAMDLEV